MVQVKYSVISDLYDFELRHLWERKLAKKRLFRNAGVCITKFKLVGCG